MLLYRILSLIVNFFCAFLTFITITGITLALANPALLLQCFLCIGTILYAWFANRFYHTVLVAKKTMTKKQKDWLMVNAIVALIFSLLGIGNSVYILVRPQVLTDLLSQMPEKVNVSQSALTNVSVFLLAVCFILLIHVVATLLLAKKNKEYFETAAS